MIVRGTAALFLAFASLCSAWTVSNTLWRKAASFGAAASLSTAILTAPLVASANVDFDGHYSDPKHPNCLRVVKANGPVALITGTDGNPGCPPDGSGTEWSLTGKIVDNSILVDFTPKGGPPNLKGVWEGGDMPGIRWPDGNKWGKNRAMPNYETGF